MTQEIFKEAIERPINNFKVNDIESAHFWTSIHIKNAITRTLRLALQYPELAQEYLDSLPKVVNE
jgi:uncharacterized protein (DUF4213/DUF364 family)